jgi:hypothetical protein
MVEKRNAYRIVVGTPERRRLLERSRDSWEDNIRMDPRGTGWEVVHWINFVCDRDNSGFFLNTVINNWFCKMLGIFVTNQRSVRCSRRTLLHAVRYLIPQCKLLHIFGNLNSLRREIR